MKAIQLRLGFTLELIAGLALGIALAKSYDRQMYDLPWESIPDRVVSTGFHVLSGFILLNGIMLGIERRVRRSPTVWGAGRYFLMCSFLMMICSFVWYFFWQLVMPGHDHTANVVEASENARFYMQQCVYNLPGIALAGLVSAGLARWPLRGSSTDLRETLGRVVLALILIVWVVERGLGCYDRFFPVEGGFSS